MKSDDDVRRFLEHMAAEPGFGTVDPTPVLRRAYRRLARTMSVLGSAGVALVVAIAMGGPSLLHALPGPARVVPGTTSAAGTPQVARITCLGHGRSQLQATTVAVQPDGLHVAIVQQHAGRPSEVFVRQSGWVASVGFSTPDHTRFRTVPSVDASVGHVAIGCFESPSEWPTGSGAFHRLTLVEP